MSAPVAFSVLISQVQNRANIENQSNLITAVNVRDFLNEGLTEFHDMLVAARGEEHFRKAQNFNTVALQSAYPLAADFYELISMDVQIAPNQFITAKNYMERERNAFRLYPGYTLAGGLYEWWYRIQGTTQDQNTTLGSLVEKTLNIIPTPQAAYAVTLNYIWRYPTFDTAGSQDSNVVNGVNGWEAYAVWHAVELCKHKLKEDASFAAARKAELKERIEAMADQNDAGRSERIQDVETDFDSYAWWR